MGRSASMAWVVAAMFSFFAVPGAAQTIPYEHRCWGEPGDEARCAAVRLERQRELYGLASIEQLGRDGVQVRRIFYVDGSGVDVGAISFIRAPGRAPEVSYQAPGEAGLRPPPLVAAVPAETWTAALTFSINFHRRFVPIEEEPEQICMHGWSYTVEAADPALGDQEATSYRGTEHACEPESPAPGLARGLSYLTIALFPSCMRIDPENYYNAVTRLHDCAQLSGDTMTAAEARNTIAPLLSLLEEDGLTPLRRVFAARARLDWGGDTVEGGDAAAARWRRGFFEHPHSQLRVTRIEGVTRDRVLVDGVIAYWAEGAERSRAREAIVRTIWSRGPSGLLTIDEATVEPFRPVGE